jgi:hypothetical protein
VNLRHGIAAAALLATTAFTVACAAPTAGTASAGGAVASVATTSSSAAASSSAAPSSTTASPSSSSAATTQIQDAPVVIAPPTVVNQAPGLDATTAIWLQNSCTDVETLLGALLTYPAVDEFRIAYRDYYATVSDTVLGITERMSVLDAPTIDGGQDLHDGYLAYLVGLADITAGAAIAIDAAPDAETVAAIIEQVDFEIEQLGQSDYGLADFQGDELQALMSQVPACQTLVNS